MHDIIESPQVKFQVARRGDGGNGPEPGKIDSGTERPPAVIGRCRGCAYAAQLFWAGTCYTVALDPHEVCEEGDQREEQWFGTSVGRNL